MVLTDVSLPTCEWCGHAHSVTALCSKRPTWGRRGFLALAGMGAVGLLLPAADRPPVPVEWTWLPGWHRVVVTTQDGNYYYATVCEEIRDLVNLCSGAVCHQS